MLAFWREQYQGFENFQFKELMEVISTDVSLAFNNRFNFTRLALSEIAKYHQPQLIKKAAQLVNGIDSSKIKGWAKPGIRAQLVDITKRKLVMDFCYQGDENSFHLLNAVSPAFTCSLSLAEFCVDKIEEFRN